MSSTSKARYPRAVVIPVLVVTLIALVAMFWHPGAGASVGDRVVGGRVTGTEPLKISYAQLPFGSVQISVAKGQAVNVDGAKQEVGGDAEWVQVSWEPSVASDTSRTTVWPGATRAERQEPPSRLILRAGGTDHVVASNVRSGDGAGSAALAIEKTEDVSVLVSTAGGTARPTRAGATSTQAGSLGRGSSRCQSDPRAEGLGHYVDCLFQTTRALYIPGLGLAPKGKSWVVVRDARILQRRGTGDPPSVGSWTAEDGSVTYRASGKPTLRLEVNGAGRPVKTVGRDSLTTIDPRLATRAYLVAADKPASVTMHYTTATRAMPSRRPVAGAPKSTKISARATVRIKPDGSAAPATER